MFLHVSGQRGIGTAPPLSPANTDGQPRRTFDMNQRAPRNDVALPQHQIGRGSQLLATASDVDDGIFRVLLAKPGNGLADLGRRAGRTVGSR